jgi:hypothetical protein
MKCLFYVCGTKMLQFNLQDPDRVLTVRPQTCQDLDRTNAAYVHHINFESTESQLFIQVYIILNFSFGS